MDSTRIDIYSEIHKQVGAAAGIIPEQNRGFINERYRKSGQTDSRTVE
jgi:hypothetical protein